MKIKQINQSSNTKPSQIIKKTEENTQEVKDKFVEFSKGETQETPVKDWIGKNIGRDEISSEAKKGF